jgi:hypothetical protein
MPRYHFDTECRELRYYDQYGVELNSVEHAQQQLLGLLRDMALHDDVEGFGKTVTAQVRCAGNIVLQGSCSVTINCPPVWSPKL